ncbi:MAG: glycosyltransferase family 2 protein [Armatimonadetes bacterium]|nr:glycosyltransferase family 2 protein [Armatimonadota bacterium]
MISVIIPNRNGESLLPTCLNSLAGQNHSDYEVIVVDNHSWDGSLDLLRSKYDWVRVTAMETQKSISTLCNAGIRIAKGDLLFFLNNDTEVHPDCLKEMEWIPGLGSCAPLVLSFHFRTLIDSVGLCVRTDGRAENYLGGRPVEEAPPDRTVLLGPAGSACLYRKSVVQEIGGWDEDYDFYYEDVDLALRARMKGYGCAFCRNAVVYHMGGATLNPQSERGNLPAKSRQYFYFTLRNSLLCLAKNFPWPLILQSIPSILLVESALFLESLKRGYLSTWLRSRFDCLFLLPLFLEKRGRTGPRKAEAMTALRSLMLKPDWTFYKERAERLFR